MRTTIKRVVIDQSLWDKLRDADRAHIHARLAEMRTAMTFEALPITDPEMIAGRKAELCPLKAAATKAKKDLDAALEAVVHAEIERWLS